MSKTQETLDKLGGGVKCPRLWAYVELANIYYYDGNMELYKEYKNKIRGYLIALVDTGVITPSEDRVLFNYFVTIRNSAQNT